MEDDAEHVPAYEAARRDAQSRAGADAADGAIAVLPLYGTIVQRASMLGLCEGGTSTQDFVQGLRAAKADPQVGQILLDIHSPGGSVYGVEEAAAEITETAKAKPVIAIANSLAASAAYWLGSAASELYVTPGGEVGSIGVWMAHEDWSKALEAKGVAHTIVSAGKYKTEGHPFGPLEPESREFLQSRVNDYYKAFTKGVARGRRVSIDQVRNGMGQGRVLGAEAAQAEQMVDGVMTFDELVRDMRRKPRGQAATTGRRAEAEPTRIAHARRRAALLGG
jgi:signal peptide peptidase SppA